LLSVLNDGNETRLHEEIHYSKKLKSVRIAENSIKLTIYIALLAEKVYTPHVVNVRINIPHLILTVLIVEPLA
jgi:hypothetical protein